MTLEEIFRKRFGKRWRIEVARYMNWSTAKLRYVIKNPSRYITFDDADLLQKLTGVKTKDLYAAIYFPKRSLLRFRQIDPT